MVDRLNRFNGILDDCISRITLKGETVESCLKLYPEDAAELEPYLRMTTRVAQTYAFTPGSDAKERARQRLYAERVAIRDQSSEKGNRRTSRSRVGVSWLPRWATVTIIAVLVVLFSSFGTVAASGSAMPGDLLYPVKRSTEQALLGLQFSPEGKAKVSLTYAQRRANEMAALMKEGNVPQLAGLSNDLKQNLDVAARVIDSVKNVEAKAELQTQLQENVVQSLGNLQAAAQEAPESSRQAAVDSFIASSQALSNAVETVTVIAPVVAMAPGILQLMATDPPPPNVEKVLVTVDQIEVHLSAGADSRWIKITQEPQTFDLLRVVEIQKFLGQKPVEPGMYTQIRFHITGTTVVAGGKEITARVPGDALHLQRPFIIEEGKITAVVLDFDGARSLQVTGQDQFMIRPVVSVLVHKPGQWSKETETGGDKRGKDKGSGKWGRAEFEGRVESLSADSIVVKGVTINLSPSTRIEGKPEVGQKVEIETQVRPDGSFLAVKVESKEARKDDRSGRSESRGPSERTSEISGTLQSINGSEWVVNGQKVKLTGQTEVKGQATAGSTVKVEGSVQTDGSILAREITVIASGRPQEKKEEKKQEPPRTDIRFEGIVEKASPTEITVAGKATIITRDTRVDGDLTAGVGVEVDGQLLPDGKIQAKSIKVLKKNEERSKDEGKDKGSLEQPKPPDKKDEDKKDGEKDGGGQDKQSFSGTIEKLSSGEWTISGRTVLVGPGTRLEGTPAVGLPVSVEVRLLPDGKLSAITIKIEEKSGNSGKGPPETPRPPERRGEERGSSPGATITITGKIEKFSSTELTINGKIITIPPDTKREGVLAVGSTAHVEGQQQTDGKITAISVKITPVNDTGPKEDEKGKPKAPTETPRAPEKKDNDKEAPEKGAVVLTGTISIARLAELVVDGKTVTLSLQTEIEGTLAAGRKVKIKGELQATGKIAATSIEVIGPQKPD